MKKKVNLHIYPSPFKNESRILKETKSIIDNSIADEVIIIGTFSKTRLRSESIDPQRSVWRIKTVFDLFPKNILTDIFRFMSIQMVILIKYLPKKLDLINCHSLSVLPVGVLLRIFKKTKLIYDTHELETERAGLKGFKQKIARALERICFRYVDSTIVVSNSINRWYRQTYNTQNVFTVRNVPDLRLVKKSKNRNVLKEKFRIRNNEILYIYQGLLSKGRGIDILLNVFSDPKIKSHIVFMGYGLYEDKVKKFSVRYNNIHFQEAVPPDQIIEYSASADVGICLIEDIGLSYFFCLPNKVFEYNLAGIPVIVSDFPDLGEYIDSVNGGWKINPKEVNLKMLVSTMSLNETDQMKRKMNGIENRVGWQFEEKELIKAYHQRRV